MSSVKHMMFFKKNVKTPLLLEVKVGFVYGLEAVHHWTAFSVSHEAESTYFTWNVFFSVICFSPSAFPLNVTTASYVPGLTPFDHVS